MTNKYRVPAGSPAAQRIKDRRLQTIRRKAARARRRRPDSVKLAVRRQERRRALGLDRHEPVGDEWER